jgi:hypothetical protein
MRFIYQKQKRKSIMNQALTSYYFTELTDWSRTLEYCLSEMPEFEARLAELIHRNTIPQLAINAEHFLKQFRDMLKKINTVIKEIRKQQEQIKLEDVIPLNNERLLSITNKQNLLRNKMQATEKDFVDLKYSCYNFFSTVEG